jgi:hypothetical protein
LNEKRKKKKKKKRAVLVYFTMMRRSGQNLKNSIQRGSWRMELTSWVPILGEGFVQAELWG